MRKSMSLRRAVKRRNVLIVDDYKTGGLETIPVTNKNKTSQRHRYSNQAIKPFKIAYTAKQLDDMTCQTFEHIFKDKQRVSFLASVLLFGPLMPIRKPRELAVSQ